MKPASGGRGVAGYRGLGDGAGLPAQVANTPDGPSVLDAQGATVYTAAQVAADPSLLSTVPQSGCPAGLIPTYSMAGPQCTVVGGNPDCADPTGVCGSYLLPGQSLSQANQGWVLVGSQWVWNGPGSPTTPSPGQINELAGNLVPTFSQAQTTSAAANTQTSGFEGQYYPAAPLSTASGGAPAATGAPASGGGTVYQPQATPAGGTSGGGGTNVIYVSAPAAAASTGSPFDISFLTQTVNVLGVDVPVWGLALGAIVGVPLLTNLLSGR